MNRFACRILVPFKQLAHFKVLCADAQLQVVCTGTSNLRKGLDIEYILYVLEEDTDDCPEQGDFRLLEEDGCKVEDIHEEEIDKILAKYFQVKPA